MRAEVTENSTLCHTKLDRRAASFALGRCDFPFPANDATAAGCGTLVLYSAGSRNTPLDAFLPRIIEADFGGTVFSEGGNTEAGRPILANLVGKARARQMDARTRKIRLS